MNKILQTIALMLCTFLFTTTLHSQSWKFKNSLNGFVGVMAFDSDLGTTLGFRTGLEAKMYNTAIVNTPLVINGRVAFQNFSAERNGLKANREFLEVAGGIGLHIYEIIFFTINGGYLHQISDRQNSNAEFLGNFYGSVRGELHVFRLRGKGFSMYAFGEAIMTLYDVEAIDQGEADQYRGTAGLSFGLGFQKTFGDKEEESSDLKIIEGFSKF